MAQQESKATSLIDDRLTFLKSYKAGLETGSPENKKEDIEEKIKAAATQISELERLKRLLYQS